MAIYDPELTIENAITRGTLYTAQIDANSHTVVNIGLKYYEYISKRSSYNYGMQTLLEIISTKLTQCRRGGYQT
jgi:hypothetical protein